MTSDPDATPRGASDPTRSDSIAGLLLAAGSGSRLGMPKAFMRYPDGRSWLRRAVELLQDAGCSPVIVVLGARADDASLLLPRDDGVRAIVAAEWSSGLAASLCAGLVEAQATGAASALVTLVDLPELPLASLVRVRSTDPAALRQAEFDEAPGHPVLLGRSHWADIIATATGDSGARGYLRAHGAERIDCSDLGGGHDVDSLEMPDDGVASS